jgi:hypothetical protein
VQPVRTASVDGIPDYLSDGKKAPFVVVRILAGLDPNEKALCERYSDEPESVPHNGAAATALPFRNGCEMRGKEVHCFMRDCV